MKISLATSINLIATPDYTKNLIILTSRFSKQVNVYELDRKHKNCTLVNQFKMQKYL